MKRVLVLGSGLVAGPVVHYLLTKGFTVTIATKNTDRAQQLVNNHPKGHIEQWDANQQTALTQLVSKTDLVINILPHEYHLAVAKVCLAQKKHLVMGSYLKPEIAKLHHDAQQAGILILSECGLDPGIDHMSAKRIIDTVQGFGGKVTKFYTFCGALPSPEVAQQNPMHYKFTWSPSGVLQATNRAAQYLHNKTTVQVSAEALMQQIFTIKWPKIGPLEVYANGDAVGYKKLYGLDETVTMYRGTLRYPGWCKSMDALKKLGLLKTQSFGLRQVRPSQLLLSAIGLSSGKDLRQKTLKWLETTDADIAVQNLEYLGFFDNEAPVYSGTNPFDITRAILLDKMKLQEGERDTSLLQHLIMADYPDGRHEVITSRLLDFGVPETETSVARTVGLPLACAASMILENEINVQGVHLPILPDIYNPVLLELENQGIELVEDYGLPLSFDILP